MGLRARTVHPSRVRARVAALAAVAVAAVSVGLAGPAAATTRDGGALTPGQQVVATFADSSDTVTYTVDVPAHQRLTLLALDSSKPLSVDLTAATPERFWPITQYFGATGSTPRLAQLSATAGAPHGVTDTDRTVTLTLHPSGGPSTSGDFPFLPALVTDPDPIQTAIGTSVTVRVTQPGQQVPISVPSVPGHLIALKVSAVDLTRTVPVTTASRLYHFEVVAPGGRGTSVYPLAGDLLRPSVYGGLDPAETGPWQIFASAVDASTGSYTVEVIDALTTTTPITLGQTVTADLSAPLTEAHFTVPVPAAQRLTLTVTAASLVHADGSPGSATAAAGTVGYARLLGTISQSPVILAADQATTATATPELVITTDTASTGSVTFTLSTADDPTEALEPGIPGTATISAPGGIARFTVPETAGRRFTFTITDAALTSPTSPTLTTGLNVFLPGKATFSYAGVLEQTTTTKTVTYRLTTAPPDGTITLLVDPGGDITGSLTVTAT